MEKEITPTMERMNSEYLDALNEVEPEPPQRFSIPVGFYTNVNLGINTSIALILLIFSGFLLLPSKLFLEASNKLQNETVINVTTSQNSNVIDTTEFRKKRLCPRPDYKYSMISIFQSNYDRNCTFAKIRTSRTNKKMSSRSSREKFFCTRDRKETTIGWGHNRTIDRMRTTRLKYVPVTGHILAMMLIVSAVAAFVEVLRIRFINPKDTSTVETAGSRKGSTVELMIHRRYLPRAPMRSQRSLELPGMQRTGLRILGSCTPPLLRRSSFPTYLAETMDIPTAIDNSSTRSASRRTSVNAEPADPGIFTSALHRRTHLIRRH